MATFKIPIFRVKLPFYPPCKVKCGLQNGVSIYIDTHTRARMRPFSFLTWDFSLPNTLPSIFESFGLFFGRAWILHNCLENCDIYIYIYILGNICIFVWYLLKTKKIIESYIVTHSL